jgi:hypothetical protein
LLKFKNFLGNILKIKLGGLMYNESFDKLNYSDIFKKYPWIFENNMKVIISPDVDGILSGLFMSNYFNWLIVGYYDGKQLALKKEINFNDCIFLDMEIFRKNVKSCGHHLVLYNKNKIPKNWDNFSNCINPNMLRNYDANQNFKYKYPFAMIHFLLSVISYKKNISISDSAISPLLYVDGTFKNLLNYPENCISWLEFLNAKNASSPINSIYCIFARRRISNIIHDLERIFENFKIIGGNKRKSDKIDISLIKTSTKEFPSEYIQQINKLITFLSENTRWEFDKEKWTF